MKSILFIFGFLFLWGQVVSQKGQTVQSANLNMSKSNINSLVYPSTILTAANAQLLLIDLEKAGSMDVDRQKTWLASNFKRFGIEPTLVKQISIFTGRQYADCTICKQHCKGRCVQDPGADCVCISHSEPNLRITQSEKPLTIILLFTEAVEETAALELVSNTISSARSTTVKSSKSNSSD